MSGIALTAFGGVKPKVDAHLLQPYLAQTASNCRVASGAISSWRQPLTINTPTKAGTKLSIYRIAYSSVDYWLHWTTDVDVVKSQIANDAYNRYYYTGDGAPKVTTDALATQGAGTDYPLASFTLGLPIPPTPTISGIAGGVGANQTRSYVYTEVTLWGEEGPPSLPVTGTGKNDATWTIATLPTTQPAGGTYQVVSKNIYRTVLASDGTSTYLLVANVALASATYADAALDAALTGGTVLPSTTWVAPPSTLSGLISLPNGSMAGFTGNQLCISEPFQPHAWPTANRYSVDSTIVGIKANGSTIAVCTTTNPYTFTGVNPGAMTSDKSKVVEPCLSKRSVVDVGWGVIYASPNGLVDALSAVSEIVSGNAILPNSWISDYYPSAMFGAVYQGAYHGYYTHTVAGVTTGGGVVWDKLSNDNGFKQITDVVTAAWLDPTTGLLYVVIGGVIKQWDADTNNQSTFDWKSKTFIDKKPVNYGAIQVNANYASMTDYANEAAQLVLDQAFNTVLFANDTTRGPLGSHMIGEVMLGGSAMHGAGATVFSARSLTIYLYAGGVLKYAKSFSTNAAAKLPSGYKSDTWEIRAGGNIDCYSIKVAENTKALQLL